LVQDGANVSRQADHLPRKSTRLAAEPRERSRYRGGVSASVTETRRNQDDRAALDLRLAQILAMALVRAFRDETAASSPRRRAARLTREGVPTRERAA